VRAFRTGVRTAVALAPWVYLGVLRPGQLRWGATPEEVQRDLPGDRLVPHPLVEATRALTVEAGPDDVWPWVVQMGTGRGGWYAIDLLDNGRHRSADRIVPQLQQLQVGDLVPTDSSGRGFTVVAIERPSYVVLHIAEASMGRARGSVVVTITLDPRDGGLRTRLLCRLRGDAAADVPSRLYAALLEVGDFVMVRLMLAGIRARAERTAALRP
jgi:hypothetical protein